MPSRSLARPTFPLAPEQYSREYMDRLVQSFAVFLEQYQNPGEGRSTKSVMTAVPTSPTGLEDGTVWKDSTILRIGTGITPGVFALPNLEVTGTLDITGALEISGVSVTASAAELNYNDITTLGTVEENKTVTAGASKAIDFNNAPMTNVDIDSGSIDNTVVGGTTPLAGTFTTITGTTSVTTPLVTNAGTLALSATGANIITAETNGGERARVTDAGMDVTGTLTSDGLAVSGEAKLTTTSGIGLQLHNESSGQVYLQFTNSVTGETSSSGFQVGIDAAEEGLVWHYRSEPIKFATGNSERMRVTSTGDVGINETSPNYRLDVNGDLGFTPGSSVTPVDNGDVVFELTNNTTLTVKAKGSDGVVRTGTIILS